MSPKLQEAINRLVMHDAIVRATILTGQNAGLCEADMLANVVLNLAASKAALESQLLTWAALTPPTTIAPQKVWQQQGRLRTAEEAVCWCQTCRPITMNDSRMVLCPSCGNKRCPRANDHNLACTGSNEPGQPGSAYPHWPAKGGA